MKFELSSAAGNDPYLIHSETEIVFVLRAIMRRNTLVALYFSKGNDFILTSILDIDADRRKMVLDYGARDELNQQALAADKLVFVTSQDQVKVQFVCHGMEKIQFDGRSAFSVGIPQSLLRLQRREYYRIATPAINPLKCAIPLAEGRGTAEVVLLNISLGGMAIIDHHPEIDCEPGATHENCRVVLPGIGTLHATIRVKTTSDVTLKNGLNCKRCGCEFVAMPKKMLAMVARYLVKLERERNAKRAGSR